MKDHADLTGRRILFSLAQTVADADDADALAFMMDEADMDEVLNLIASAQTLHRFAADRPNIASPEAMTYLFDRVFLALGLPTVRLDNGLVQDGEALGEALHDEDTGGMVWGTVVDVESLSLLKPVYAHLEVYANGDVQMTALDYDEFGSVLWGPLAPKGDLTTIENLL